MEQNTNFEIEIISNETIKPSLPTPPHLKTFKLSLIDQIFPAFHIPLLLFYNTQQPNDIPALKSSLSDTLSSFPPLSGRCTDDSTVSCTDQGVPFVEARVNCQLKQLIDNPNKLGFLTELLPPREFLALGPRDISDLVPLAFQVNVFSCGGVVIGCYMLHKLLDASSLGTFFHHWSAHTSNRHQDLDEPDYESIVKAFLPSQSIERVIVPNLDSNSNSNSNPNSVNVLVKNFRISKTSIAKLKEKAGSETQPNPTSFETITGFIWKNVFSAACTSRATKNLPIPETTTLSLSINMRSRTNPKLPNHSMGNCITDVQAKSSTTSSTLPELVTEIHHAVTKSKAKIERFQGENGVEEICQDRKASSQFVMEDSECAYQVSSWSNSGLSEADFGFGKANMVAPTDGNVSVSLRNFVFFTDYWDFEGDGVDVWLFLEENELEVLGANEKFLEYAFPN